MEKCCECLSSVRNNPRALIALKVYSLLSGIFLTVAGLVGCIIRFTDPFRIVVGVYAMIFGFMVVVVEHGTWLDNVSFLQRFYQLLDQEFHLLAFQRGKGFFYSGAGVLTLFTDETSFSLVGGASICLIVAGVLHSFRIVHEENIGSGAKGPPPPGSMGPAQDAGSAPPVQHNYPDSGGARAAQPPSAPPQSNVPPPPPPAAGSAASEWSAMVASQEEREAAGAATPRGEDVSRV